MSAAEGLPQWVILGAETGNRADKVAPRREWVDQITQFCAENEIPVFYKDNLRAHFPDLPPSASPWLKETVDPEILQTALDHTMEKYPLFQVVLRKGLFWFYLERRDIRAVAKKEVKPPCSRLYIPDKKSLLFEVSYYENRINFEVYHALTDGTGARNFLQELVQNYLKLQHPETRFPETETRQRATFRDHEEDSFSQYYSSETPKNKEKNPRAVRLKGEMLGHDDTLLSFVNP